jgi:S-DNA-T family DNA segregation ATPase FtsK/SpoIIIE
MNEITLQRIINENLAICNGSGLVAPIGFNEKGGIEYTDYSQIPNLLVCGTTGSGKTTFVRTLIASLAAIAKPTDVRFLIFDYRGNDYIEFSNLPHLLLPIGKDATKITIANNNDKTFFILHSPF